MKNEEVRFKKAVVAKWYEYGAIVERKFLEKDFDNWPRFSKLPGILGRKSR